LYWPGLRMFIVPAGQHHLPFADPIKRCVACCGEFLGSGWRWVRGANDRSQQCGYNQDESKPAT
jgi:hypothetical protein